MLGDIHINDNNNSLEAQFIGIDKYILKVLNMFSHKPIKSLVKKTFK